MPRFPTQSTSTPTPTSHTLSPVATGRVISMSRSIAQTSLPSSSRTSSRQQKQRTDHPEQKQASSSPRETVSAALRDYTPLRMPSRSRWPSIALKPSDLLADLTDDESDEEASLPFDFPSISSYHAPSSSVAPSSSSVASHITTLVSPKSFYAQHMKARPESPPRSPSITEHSFYSKNFPSPAAYARCPVAPRLAVAARTPSPLLSVSSHSFHRSPGVPNSVPVMDNLWSPQTPELPRDKALLKEWQQVYHAGIRPIPFSLAPKCVGPRPPARARLYTPSVPESLLAPSTPSAPIGARHQSSRSSSSPSTPSTPCPMERIALPLLSDLLALARKIAPAPAPAPAVAAAPCPVTPSVRSSASSLITIAGICGGIFSPIGGRKRHLSIRSPSPATPSTPCPQAGSAASSVSSYATLAGICGGIFSPVGGRVRNQSTRSPPPPRPSAPCPPSSTESSPASPFVRPSAPSPPSTVTDSPSTPSVSSPFVRPAAPSPPSLPSSPFVGPSAPSPPSTVCDSPTMSPVVFYGTRARKQLAGSPVTFVLPRMKPIRVESPSMTPTSFYHRMHRRLSKTSSSTFALPRIQKRPSLSPTQSPTFFYGHTQDRLETSGSTSQFTLKKSRKPVIPSSPVSVPERPSAPSPPSFMSVTVSAHSSPAPSSIAASIPSPPAPSSPAASTPSSPSVSPVAASIPSTPVASPVSQKSLSPDIWMPSPTPSPQVTLSPDIWMPSPSPIAPTRPQRTVRFAAEPHIRLFTPDSIISPPPRVPYAQSELAKRVQDIIARTETDALRSSSVLTPPSFPRSRLTTRVPHAPSPIRQPVVSHSSYLSRPLSKLGPAVLRRKQFQQARDAARSSEVVVPLTHPTRPLSKLGPAFLRRLHGLHR